MLLMRGADSGGDTVYLVTFTRTSQLLLGRHFEISFVVPRDPHVTASVNTPPPLFSGCEDGGRQGPEAHGSEGEDGKHEDAQVATNGEVGRVP